MHMKSLEKLLGNRATKSQEFFFRFVSGFGILWKKSLMKFQYGELDRIGVFEFLQWIFICSLWGGNVTICA